MARIAVHPGPTRTFAPLKRWIPSLGFWAVGTGTAAVYFLSVTPKVKSTFLVKIPVICNYFEDKTLPEDRPF